jgi:S-adenosylmethionine hydrolase
MSSPVITLLTDFGTRDHYVASMKGVILRINPKCTLVDITHKIKAHDIQEGAFILANAYSFFPKGTIHLALVDPGVGGARKPILFVTSNYFFVGPDNGIFGLALRREKVRRAIELNNGDYFLPQVSSTFHGRDLFAPVAAHLSMGVHPKEFGGKINSWEACDFNRPVTRNKKLEGEVFHIDAFGNLVTNIEEETLYPFIKGHPFGVQIKNIMIRDLKKGYWEGKKGEIMALIGSGGFLEISVREGNARDVLKAKRGEKIEVRLSR